MFTVTVRKDCDDADIYDYLLKEKFIFVINPTVDPRLMFEECDEEKNILCISTTSNV